MVVHSGGALPPAHAQMEASLTCAVCLSLFEEPVTLPVCSHNFCRACAVECLSSAGDGLSASSAVEVSCPLCRKLCPLPAEGGAAALPVNTTLAEVVKLFRASKAGPDGDHKAAAAASPSSSAAASSSEVSAPQLAALGEPCAKHPARPLQFYCRLCLRAGCGQCVSEEHRGLFHAVNLIDTVYQEEKLAFFSNLKKIRELHLNLQKEAAPPRDAWVAIQNEEEIIKTEFEKICKALEMRKKQLLEDLESRKKRKEKECLIRKRMKDIHRKTIEKVLNDCEKILDECEPQRFLEVACSLNQRMKTQLDLMQIASKQENQSKCRQEEMDTTSIVNDILALKLTAVNMNADADSVPGGNISSISANCGNKLEDKKDKKDTFHQVAAEDTVLDNGRSIPSQYTLVSATAESGNVSHEVACSLNQRMKTQLDLMQIASKQENQTKCRQEEMDTTSIVNNILALKLTAVNLNADAADTAPGGSVSSISANCGSKSEDKKDKKDTFCEVRHSYYMKNLICPSKLQVPSSSLNGSHTPPQSLPSRKTLIVPFCLSAEEKDEKKRKMQLTLQRQRMKAASWSDSVGFIFKAQAVNFNFSGLSNNLHQVNMKEAQNVEETQNCSKEITLSKDTNSCLNASKIPLLPAVTVPSETHLSSTVFPKVPMSAATSASTLSFYSLGAVAKPSIALLDSSSSGNLTTSKGSGFYFKKESEVLSTRSPVKSVTHDCNTSNMKVYNSSDSVAVTTTTTTASKPVILVSDNPPFSAFYTNSESDCFQKTKPISSDQNSFIHPLQKVMEENKAAFFSMGNNEGLNCPVPSTGVPAEDLLCNTSITSNLDSKTSSSAFAQTGASKKEAVPTTVSSNNYF